MAQNENYNQVDLRVGTVRVKGNKDKDYARPNVEMQSNYSYKK